MNSEATEALLNGLKLSTTASASIASTKTKNKDNQTNHDLKAKPETA